MKRWIYSLALLGLIIGLAWSCEEDDDFWESMIPETEQDPTQSQIEGYVFKPALEPASDENIDQLNLPEGFTIRKFAENVGNPRILVTTGEGYVYYSDRNAGTVVLLEDTDGDGSADRNETVATIPMAHGLAIDGDQLFIAAVREIYVADIHEDGTLGSPEMLTDQLPDGGQHPNRTLNFGPDGMMYITVGSTCNACAETNDFNATILRANPDGSNIEIFAEGLRNTIGFGWHPDTGEMWGMDHGIDWLGDTEQKEELNRLEEGNNYGWPYIFGDGNYNPGDRPPGNTTYEDYLELTTLPVLTYTAHAAPMEMEFYTGSQFPEEYHNDAFIAFRGSWNRSSPVGYKIVRLNFEEGEPVAFEDFVGDFLVNGNRAHFGRIVGLAITPDGSLLVSDDTNGMIYRISYEAS